MRARKLEPVSDSIVPVSEGDPFVRSAAPALARYSGTGLGFVLVTALTLVCGYGWLYLLRGLGWLGGRPGVGDALPLLQLAGFDVQPLARVLVAWLLAGLLAGLLLRGVRPAPRAAAVALIGLLLLLAGSQAAYALARNLRFGHVLFGHLPGAGGFVEAAALAAGSYLPGGVIGRLQRPERAARHGRVGALRHRGLSRGEHRHASQDHRDRDDVGDHHERLRAQ